MANALIAAGADLGDETSTIEALMVAGFDEQHIVDLHGDAVEEARIIKASAPEHD